MDDCQSETRGDTETKHSINEGTHNLEMHEGDKELREGEKSPFVQKLGLKAHAIIKLGALLLLLLVIFIVIGEGSQNEACFAALI